MAKKNSKMPQGARGPFRDNAVAKKRELAIKALSREAKESLIRSA